MCDIKTPPDGLRQRANSRNLSTGLGSCPDCRIGPFLGTPVTPSPQQLCETNEYICVTSVARSVPGITGCLGPGHGIPSGLSEMKNYLADRHEHIYCVFLQDLYCVRWDTSSVRFMYIASIMCDPVYLSACHLVICSVMWHKWAV